VSGVALGLVVGFLNDRLRRRLGGAARALLTPRR
jgi:hypothetical protein